MDILQLLIGLAFLFFGGMISSKNKDNKSLILGLIFIIIGVSLAFNGIK
jgi:hypothetical protein